MISIIIPVYNAAGDLRRCLDSILRQTVQDFEVWLINDGSTDSSAWICEEYVQKYSNFNVYHGENAGVSSARNIGIEKSRGSYLTFIDADDHVEDHLLEVLLSESKEDFAICACQIHQPNGDSKIEQINCSNQDQHTISIILNHQLVRAVWGKLFKREIIIQNQILFDQSLRIGEDTLFVLTYLSYIDTAKISRRVGYLYESPPYKVNKYNMFPFDLISLNQHLNQIELQLESKGYIIDSLKKSNRRIIGFNLLSLLYLSSKFNYTERKTYREAFNEIDSKNKENMGLPKWLHRYYFRLLQIGNERLIDFFLTTVMHLIWWKSKVLKTKSV